MIIIMYPMRVTRQTQADHHAAMLDQAGRLFRARGIEAVGVADITRAAGLTHGAFYGHFASKSALAADVCRASLRHAAESWHARIARARANGRDPLDALIAAYLTPSHRDSPDQGCALPTIGAESIRDPVLRAALADGTIALLDALAEAIALSRPAVADRRAAATAVLAALVGGLLIARALADTPAASDAALIAAATAAHRAAA